LYELDSTVKHVYPGEISRFTIASSREDYGIISIYPAYNPEGRWYIKNDRVKAGTKAVFWVNRDLKRYAYNKKLMKDPNSEYYVPDL